MARQPAFGWAAQYALSAKGQASLSLSQFPLVPLVVLLELAAWVLLALALIGRPRGTRAPSVPTLPVGLRDGDPHRDGHVVTPAHVSRERRWRVAALVVLVVAGVGIAVGVRGGPAPVAAAPIPSALVGAPDAESSAWYCTGQSMAGGVSPGFLVLTNTTSKSVTADITATSDSGATAHTAAAIPAYGVVAPAIPTLASGSWVSETVITSGGGVAVTQTVAGSLGWSQAPCQSTTSARWYFASGSTAAANTLYVSLLNPTSTPVVVDLSFATPAGMVHPINYQGIVLQPGQVAVENVTSEVQQTSTVSTVVSARTGRVVAAEVQSLVGPGATSGGLALVPGVAAPQAQWAIPQAQEDAGVSSRNRCVQPRRVDRGGHAAVPAAVRTVGATHGQGVAGNDLGGPDELGDAHPCERNVCDHDRRHGRARCRRGPDGERPSCIAVAPGRRGRWRWTV